MTLERGLSRVSAAQIRAARALLGITAMELASLSGITWKTVQRFETAKGVPPSRSGTLEKVKAALEASGIEFTGDAVLSPGVALRNPAAPATLTRLEKQPSERLSPEHLAAQRTGANDKGP